jgi:hypothetical protein
VAERAQHYHLTGFEWDLRDERRPRLPLLAVGPTVILKLPGDQTSPTGMVHQFPSLPLQASGGCDNRREIEAGHAQATRVRVRMEGE